ncbi:hypothetical protein JOF29_001651 [Kribbella aluminosa]|uniref:Galactose mutarotase-like enzyme n=1 Tax=Kribbella aluminosa TaxID=416017 RepID=A0ABS4UG24_9ACTN|nr:hypothetical protein [Kribbella aluminosa]MBP2350568.1 hypothetical protein [Kribbella aluminosa]
MAVDLADGGRWTSLRLGGREWLWDGPGLVDGARTGMTTFVDAGGVDECFPTVRGTPDHGALWNQRWGPSVSYDGATLSRTFSTGHDSMTVDYHLQAVPGYRFVWAAHALLDCVPGATITADCSECRLYPDDGPWITSTWPAVTTYGPTDGTAVGAVLVDCPTVSVRDRGAELTMTLSCPGQPTSTAVWRNQGGFPAEAPYRSLGVEPMLGKVFDLAAAGPDDAAVVPASGELTWRLVLSARPV